MEFGNRLDERGMKFVEAIRNDFLSEVMMAYTSLGSVPIAVVMLVFFYYFAAFHVFAALAGAILVSVVIVHLMKEFFDRERPENQVCLPSFSSSFPSGHSTNGFTFATVLSFFYTGIAPVFFFFAVLVAFSRVYLGEHYPTDAIAGSAIGTGIGVAVIVLI